MPSKEEIIKNFEAVGKINQLSASELTEQYKSFLPIIEDLLENKDDAEFRINFNFKDYENLLDFTLPDSSIPFEDIIDLIKTKMIPHFSYENVNFFGYIPRSPTHVSMFADSLVPFFNQFIGNAIASPIAVSVESLVIKWIGEILGYTGNYFGSFTMGATMANADGVNVGLVNTLPWNTNEYGFNHEKRPLIYFTDQAHVCIAKSLRRLGLGNVSARIIPTDDKFEMDYSALEEQIIVDQRDPSLLPAIVVGTCGTTNTGAIDNLGEISRICQKYGMWFHVDAAYGGFVRLSSHPISSKVEDLHLADSIAIDTHKWFYTPMEGGLVLVKNEVHLYKTFQFSAEYLSDTKFEEEYDLARNFSEYGYALSRRWRGLMVWANFKFYGVEGIRKLIDRNLYLAEYFRELIKEDKELELYGNAQLGIISFRHSNEELNNHIFSEIRGSSKRVMSRTTLNGLHCLRVSILNENTELKHIDSLYSHLRDIIDNYWLLHPVE